MVAGFAGRGVCVRRRASTPALRAIVGDHRAPPAAARALRSADRSALLRPLLRSAGDDRGCGGPDGRDGIRPVPDGCDILGAAGPGDCGGRGPRRHRLWRCAAALAVLPRSARGAHASCRPMFLAAAGHHAGRPLRAVAARPELARRGRRDGGAGAPASRPGARMRSRKLSARDPCRRSAACRRRDRCSRGSRGSGAAIAVTRCAHCRDFENAASDRVSPRFASSGATSGAACRHAIKLRRGGSRRARRRSREARGAESARFRASVFALPRRRLPSSSTTGWSIGGKSPKLMFIGWKSRAASPGTAKAAGDVREERAVRRGERREACARRPRASAAAKRAAISPTAADST